MTALDVPKREPATAPRPPTVWTFPPGSKSDLIACCTSVSVSMAHWAKDDEVSR